MPCSGHGDDFRTEWDNKRTISGDQLVFRLCVCDPDQFDPEIAVATPLDSHKQPQLQPHEWVRHVRLGTEREREVVEGVWVDWLVEIVARPQTDQEVSNCRQIHGRPPGSSEPFYPQIPP